MKWGNPLVEVQEFTPQEFVASCAHPEYWTATCDDFQSLIFLPGDDVVDANRGGCGEQHTFKANSITVPNCKILKGVSTGWKNTFNITEYKELFTEESYNSYIASYPSGGSGGTGKEPSYGVGILTLSSTGKASSLLVDGFYDEEALGGTKVISCTNLGTIHNPS